jgi:cation diffusion facilitator family transporter
MINQTYPASGSRRGQECSITPSVPLDSNDNPSKSAADRAMKSTVLGIIVNLGLAVIKCSAGLIGNSFALVADGLESVTDVFSGLAVYFGLKIAVKPADADHPYGYGKAEPIAAVVVSLALMAAAFGIIYGGIREITAPSGTPAPYTLVVLAGILVIKELLFRHVAFVGESIGSIAVKSDAWHHRSDALTSAFAFVGISIALLGGPGFEAADGWAALCAALVILYNAWKQLRPAVLELADITPDVSMEAQVRAIAGRVPGVLGSDKCYVRKMGFTYYVDLHVVVQGELSVREGHRLSHTVEDEILIALPQVAEVLVHVEPEEELTRPRE